MLKASKILIWLVSLSSSDCNKCRCSTASRATPTSSQLVPPTLHRLRPDKLPKASRCRKLTRLSNNTRNNSNSLARCRHPSILYLLSSYLKPSMPISPSPTPSSKPSASASTPLPTPTRAPTTTERITAGATKATEPCRRIPSTPMPMWARPALPQVLGPPAPRGCMSSSTLKAQDWQ